MRTAGIRSINSTTGTAIAAALTELEPLVFSVAPTSLVKIKMHKTMLINCEIKKMSLKKDAPFGLTFICLPLPSEIIGLRSNS